MAASRYRCTIVVLGAGRYRFARGREPPTDQPAIEHHHRDIQTGSARAAVFGVSDGLVSNVSLILGVAGADPQPGVVRLAGLAGLIAGAVSMAAGEYVSMRAQTELFERELEIERRELQRSPHAETVELSHIYESRGVQPSRAQGAGRGDDARPRRSRSRPMPVRSWASIPARSARRGRPRSRRSSPSPSERSSRCCPGSSATAMPRSSRSVVLGAIARGRRGRGAGRAHRPVTGAVGPTTTAIAAGAATVTFVVGRVVGVGVA